MTMATKDKNDFEPAALTERGSVTRSTLITERAFKIFQGVHPLFRSNRIPMEASKCHFEGAKIIQPFLPNETAAGHRSALRTDSNSE